MQTDHWLIKKIIAESALFTSSCFVRYPWNKRAIRCTSSRAPTSVLCRAALGRPPTGLPRSRSTFAHMRSKRSVLQMHSTSISVYVPPRIQVWSWREELSEQVLKLICWICHCAGFWAVRQCGGPRSAMFSYNSQGASKNFLQVRFLKFWISFSTTTPIAQAFEQNDSGGILVIKCSSSHFNRPDMYFWVTTAANHWPKWITMQ